MSQFVFVVRELAVPTTCKENISAQTVQGVDAIPIPKANKNPIVPKKAKYPPKESFFVFVDSKINMPEARTSQAKTTKGKVLSMTYLLPSLSIVSNDRIVLNAFIADSGMFKIKPVIFSL